MCREQGRAKQLCFGTMTFLRTKVASDTPTTYLLLPTTTINSDLKAGYLCSAPPRPRHPSRLSWLGKVDYVFVVETESVLIERRERNMHACKMVDACMRWRHVQSHFLNPRPSPFVLQKGKIGCCMRARVISSGEAKRPIRR
jgi:hypothetical protein